eukprot:2771100-Amphidinium_carterae.1
MMYYYVAVPQAGVQPGMQGADGSMGVRASAQTPATLSKITNYISKRGGDAERGTRRVRKPDGAVLSLLSHHRCA